MEILKFDDEYAFIAVLVGKKVRLVVYRGGVENVCRLETVKNLIKFIQNDEGHLFSGRLQLHKGPDGIVVVVKGNAVGKINAEVLMQLIADYRLGEN